MFSEDPPTLDNPHIHDLAFSKVMEEIVAEPIATEPFPHIYIQDIFPASYYRQLLNRIDVVGNFVPVVYPGVGVDLEAKNFREYGLTCDNFREDKQLSRLHTFLESEQFARLLLSKFAATDSWGERGSAIPEEKNKYFREGRSNFTTVFDLHKDLAGYEISPHPDTPSKIITFLFYLTPNDHLRNFGTFLCTPKPEKKADLALEPRSRISSLVLKISHSLTGKYGLGQRKEWFPWEFFDIAKVAEARPNSLLVFAPNCDSFHAVRMNIPIDNPLQERLTLRGFIRSGKDASNYIGEYPHGLGRKIMFHIARATGLLR